MTPRPRVLLFDDKSTWLARISRILGGEFDVRSVSSIDGWDKTIADNPWFDCIVVDVKIEGTETTGPAKAESAIWDKHIVSPMVVVSILPLDNVRRTYGDMFYAYLEKEHIEDLPGIVRQACTSAGRNGHARNLLTAMAAKDDLLEVTYVKAELHEHVNGQMAHALGGPTIREAIASIDFPTKNDYLKACKALLMLMDGRKSSRDSR